MEPWLFYGLIGALAFGTNIIVFKLGFRGGVDPFVAQVIFSLGIMLCAVAALFFMRPALKVSLSSASLILLAGVIWGVGGLAVAIGIANSADVSKMAVVYSANVIITFVLGILVLKEIAFGPELLKTGIGVLLVVAGVVLTSLK